MSNDTTRTTYGDRVAAEHDLIPLLARPLRAPSPGLDLARAVIWNHAQIDRLSADYMKGWHAGQVTAYGTMLHRWLCEVGLWPEGYRIPIDAEGHVALAREVTGADQD